jgi:assimilatory nitrate reductase catalytic subunit
MTAVDPNLRTTRTTCPYCGVGCGVLATPDGSGGAAISGDGEHPANFGRLCSKGAALGETLALESRLLYPMIRCKGVLERVAWSDALDHVAHRLGHIVARDGAKAVAFYLSGQMLTEDYYVANKLMKGFIGSANVDTNSRLCMASSVAGHRRAFGADTVPGCYEDLDQADLLVLVGSNAAWCHPVLFQRMLANKQKRGARMVVIDPRRTNTAEEAELFLGLKPGTDTALFSGLLVHLADNGALDRGYIAQHTASFDEALARARQIAGSLAATALATGLSEADVAAFFQMFRERARGHALFAGRQPVGAGHRQGQRHPQLPSRDRPHRQSWRLAVLAHRSAQCDGWPRSRRAREPARRAYGLHATRYRSRPPLLEGAAHRHP